MLCPICSKPVAPDHPEFPFCSGRCRIIDLGNWASEKYVVSTPVEEPGTAGAPQDTEPDDE